MEDVRKSWFFQQHFDEHELGQIHKWNQVEASAIVAKDEHGRWCGYHVEDKERALLLVAMEDKEMAENWIRRMGFRLHNNGV